ncbi:MAG: glutamine--tRNA ligase, partial [Deltaproteobacteria bacterium]
VPEGTTESIDAPFFPPDAGKPGSRSVPLTREIYIERDDFALEPPKGWHRLAPGAEVRLRHACVIRCEEVVKDAAGQVTELRCRTDRSPDKKTRGTIHWVSATDSMNVEVRLYDRLFTAERPEGGEADYKTFLNPHSLVIRTGCKAEKSLASAKGLDRFQFERLGFFCLDPVATKPGAPVFNRTVALKDGWARQVARGGEQPDATATASRAATARAEDAVAPVAAAQKAPTELTAEARTLLETHGIGVEEARVISADPGLRALFHAAVSAPHGGPAKPMASLLANEVQRLLKGAGRTVSELPFGARELAELGAMTADGTLSAKLARDVLAELADKGGSPRAIAAARGLSQVADEGALGAAIAGVLGEKADVVARFRAGEQKLFGVLVGEVMRATGGKAHAKLLNELLLKQLQG